jgi:hypothetical protein
MSHTLKLLPHSVPAKAGFATLAILILGLGALALGKAPGAPVVSTAVTIDIVVVLPLLYYVLIVRGGGAPAITVLPVFRLCVAAAGLVLPPDERGLYELMAPAARLAELGMAAFVLYRLQLGVRAFRVAGTRDVLERLTAGTRAALPGTITSADRAAGAIAFEAALIWYAHRGWRLRPELPAQAVAFPGHRKSGYTGIIVGLLMVIGIELLAVHLLIATWSTVAAWILTGLTAYGVVWLIGDLQALRLRPSWVSDHTICMRLGLRWTVTTPQNQLLRVRKLGRGERVTSALSLALPNAPRVLIELKTPTMAIGAYGLRREVDSIELGLDDPDGFMRRVAPGDADTVL